MYLYTLFLRILPEFLIILSVLGFLGSSLESAKFAIVSYLTMSFWLSFVYLIVSGEWANYRLSRAIMYGYTSYRNNPQPSPVGLIFVTQIFLTTVLVVLLHQLYSDAQFGGTLFLLLVFSVSSFLSAVKVNNDCMRGVDELFRFRRRMAFLHTLIQSFFVFIVVSNVDIVSVNPVATIITAYSLLLLHGVLTTVYEFITFGRSSK